VALRQVRIVPERTCTSWVERVRRPLLDPPLPEPLETEREYGFRPAPGVACAALVVRIEETTVGRVGVRAGRAVVWTPATGGEVSVTTPVIDVRSTREITVLRDAAPEEPAWTVAGLQVVPSRCEDSGAAGAAQ